MAFTRAQARQIQFTPTTDVPGGDLQTAVVQIDTRLKTVETSQSGAEAKYLDAASNLSDLLDIATARTNLGLGSAALSASTDFLPAISSIDALSDVDTSTVAPTNGQTITWNGTNFVPTSFPVTDLSAYSTTAQADALYLNESLNLSDLADIATARTNLGLGTAAIQDSTAFGSATDVSTNSTNISTLQSEQTTQNTNISNNATAISTLQSEQTTQNTAIDGKVDKTDSIGVISDVDLTTAPTEDQVLTWDAVAGAFKPEAIPATDLSAYQTTAEADGKYVEEVGESTITGSLAVDNISLDANTITTSTGDLTIDSATNRVIIDGDLQVTGQRLETVSEQTNYENSYLRLNSNASGAPTATQDAGIEIARGTSNDAKLLWDESEGRWSVATEETASANVPLALSTDALDNISDSATGVAVTGKATSDATTDADTATTLTTKDYVDGKAGDATDIQKYSDATTVDGTNATYPVNHDGRFLAYVNGILQDEVTGDAANNTITFDNPPGVNSVVQVVGYTAQ